MNIYAGNLSPDVTEDDLRGAFQAFGHVVFVNIVKDRSNRISEGYAFIEMSVQSEGEAAIASLNGKELKGQSLRVNQVRPRSLGEVAAST